MNKDGYELQEYTDDYEIVEPEDFAKGFVKMNYEQSYNHTNIIEYDDYYTISAPSPKTNFKGVHKTLILDKNSYTPSDVLIRDVIDCMIHCAISYGRKKTIEEMIGKLEELYNDE